VRVYEVDLSGEERPPEFLLIGKLNLSSDLCQLEVNRNRVRIGHWMNPMEDGCTGYSDTVWDFVEKKCVGWHFPGEYSLLLPRVRLFYCFLGQWDLMRSRASLQENWWYTLGTRASEFFLFLSSLCPPRKHLPASSLDPSLRTRMFQLCFSRSHLHP